MTDIHRFYVCGCAPDDEEFCKDADSYVWKERDAMMEWSEMVGAKLTSEERERAAFQSGLGRGWLIAHYTMQDNLGRFKDVDFDAPENQPPDDYDEDPKVVGY